MELFDRQWTSYRLVVDHNLMEHQQVAGATAAAIEAWLAQRPAAAPPPAMADLGCGDLALLAPHLRPLPLGHYTGLDLSAAVLPLAQRALGEVPYPCQWLEGDLLAWATDAASPVIDLLHSAFAIHHLSDSQKATFLQAARRRISPNGLFLWVDVFRQPGESRAAYLERYCQRIVGGWGVLSDAQREHVLDHVTRLDQPADREAIQATAEQAGWHWRWGWNGRHGAEAMAVLTPV
ncbi:MAG: class I SAM-dependent methyltransferase [Vulcanococcus sp.]|jgi:ubiquinone/menaquinone biosynthesis C-methylase UbiE